METESFWSQLAGSLNSEPWLIAFLGAAVAVICVFIGHFLALSMNRSRANSLEKGLFNEFLLMSDYFEAWLRDLTQEFEKPIREHYSGFPEIDMSCSDALVTELVAVNRVPTKEQRRLMLNIKRKLSGIKVKDDQRDEASNWYQQKMAFNVSRPCTARLIIDAVEVIFFVSKFIEEKKKFTLNRDETAAMQAQYAFEKAGLHFDPKIWEQVIQHGPNNS